MSPRPIPSALHAESQRRVGRLAADAGDDHDAGRTDAARLEGFYMAGQWVMPGGGVAPCLYSGRHVIQLLCARTSDRSRRVCPIDSLHRHRHRLTIQLNDSDFSPPGASLACKVTLSVSALI